MAIKTIAERLYKKLTTTERIHLAIAALARQDNAEFERLNRTCPRSNYITYDFAYCNSLNRISDIKRSYLELCQYYYGKLKEYDALLFAIESSYLCYEIGYELGYKSLDKMNISSKESTRRPPKEIISLFEHKASIQSTRLFYISELKAIQKAFSTFWLETDIDSNYIIPLKLLTKLCPSINEYLAMDIEPSIETLQAAKKMFQEIWQM